MSSSGLWPFLTVGCEALICLLSEFERTTS